MSPVTHCQPLPIQMPPSILKQSINYQPSPQPLLQEKPPLPPQTQSQIQTQTQTQTQTQLLTQSQEASKGKELNVNKNAT